MKAVIQIVNDASLFVEGELISQIGKGYCVYLGVEKGDEQKNADYIIKKISNMRIFSDENDKMNLSIKDVKGEILLISQFTLLANTSHGNRPDFLNAQLPELAKVLYLYVQEGLVKNGITTKLGVFGADMTIKQTNKGPVTILL